jgi:hypothetical protein
MRFHFIDGVGYGYVETTFDSNYESSGTVQTALLSMPVEAAAIDTSVGTTGSRDNSRRHGSSEADGLA